MNYQFLINYYLRFHRLNFCDFLMLFLWDKMVTLIPNNQFTSMEQNFFQRKQKQVLLLLNLQFRLFQMFLLLTFQITNPVYSAPRITLKWALRTSISWKRKPRKIHCFDLSLTLHQHYFSHIGNFKTSLTSFTYSHLIMIQHLNYKTLLYHITP